MSTIDAGEPLALSVVQAIHAGDIGALKRLLAERSEFSAVSRLT